MRNLLLDTNVLIVYSLNSKKIGRKTRSLLNSSNLFYSPLSLFELRMKETRIKNFRSPINTQILKTLGIQPLHFDSAVETVPKLVSRDPFDLLLVAQANSRSMRFVTADMQILRSELDFVWDVTD
jgi:PIN domain nuclease of toxin-antitoxin system